MQIENQPEGLYLPEPYGVGDFEVNSDSLFTYLLATDNTYFRGQVTFAPSLDLGEIEPFLRELSEEVEIDYVFSEEDRQKLENDFGEVPLDSIRLDGIRAIEVKRRKMLRDILNEKRPAERYRSIYCGKDDDIIRVTPITHGSYAAVVSDTIEVYSRGDEPLFEIHTHPINSLFSDSDYQRMIMNVTKAGVFRLVKGAIVVCPDIQVMALAAPETIFLTIDDKDRFIARHNLDNSPLGQRLVEINRMIMEAINRPFFLHMQLYSDLLKELYEDEKYYTRGLYSKEEFEVIEQKLSDLKARTLEEAWEKTNLEVDGYLDERRRTGNQIELEIAREVNPKLYIATDFRHFTAFSA